ncbi:hypothetical protein F5888DRAFT_433674 [Russula emetica]|nr:hypothetical protein F5888DRAFT_433674 [Russula emetica]
MTVCIRPLATYMRSYGEMEGRLHDLQPIYVYCIVHWHPVLVEQMTRSAGNFDRLKCIVPTSGSPSTHWFITLFFTSDHRDPETPSSITVESDGHSTVLPSTTWIVTSTLSYSYPIRVVTSRPFTLHPPRYHRPPSTTVPCRYPQLHNFWLQKLPLRHQLACMQSQLSSTDNLDVIDVDRNRTSASVTLVSLLSESKAAVAHNRWIWLQMAIQENTALTSG